MAHTARREREARVALAEARDLRRWQLTALVLVHADDFELLATDHPGPDRLARLPAFRTAAMTP